MRNKEEIIKLENVSFGYKKKENIIRNADFSIYRGFVYGVVGKNSVGKSTLLKILCKKLPPSEGRLCYPFENGIAYKNSVEIVMDEQEFIGHLSLRNNAKVFGTLYQRFRMEEFEKQLQKSAVDGNKIFSELSDSEKIKFRLAFALSCQPEILILDEPAGVLDIGARETFIQELCLLATEKNITVIMATHLTADLDKMADYILFVNEDGSCMVYDRESLCENYMLLRGSKAQIDGLPQELLIAAEESEHFVTAMTNRFLDIKHVTSQKLIALEEAQKQNVMTERPDIETILYFMDLAYKGGSRKEKQSIRKPPVLEKEQGSGYADLKRAYHRLFDVSGRSWIAGIVGLILVAAWNITLATANTTEAKEFIKVVFLFVSYNLLFEAVKQPKKVLMFPLYQIFFWMPVSRGDILRLYFVNEARCIGFSIFVTLAVSLYFRNTGLLFFYAGFMLIYAGERCYEVKKLMDR